MFAKTGHVMLSKRRVNLYHFWGWFSRWQFFPRKQDLTCHANCHHWKCQTFFLGNKKNISLCHLLKILPSMLSVKIYNYLKIQLVLRRYHVWSCQVWYCWDQTHLHRRDFPQSGSQLPVSLQYDVLQAKYGTRAPPSGALYVRGK